MSACAVSNTRSSWVLHCPTACGAALPIRRRRCHQISQQLGSFAAQSFMSLKDQRSHGRTLSLRFLRFSNYCCHPWFRRTFVVTFCVRATHADVYPELLQDARDTGDHIQDCAPHHRCRLIFVFLCLCLCQTNLHMRVTMQAPPNRQNYNHKPVIAASKMPA